MLVFIDYVVLLLVNMTAGHLLLAAFVLMGLDEADRRRWTTGFAMSGVVAFLCGLHMVWHWPLPGSFNMAFGETSVLYGTVMLGFALSLGRGWNLLPVALYSAVAALAAIATGFWIIVLGMTQAPRVSGLGFILTGLGGLFVLAALVLRRWRWVRYAAALLLLAAMLIWARTGFGAMGKHFDSFSKYLPPTMSVP